MLMLSTSLVMMFLDTSFSLIAFRIPFCMVRDLSITIFETRYDFPSRLITELFVTSFIIDRNASESSVTPLPTAPYSAGA